MNTDNIAVSGACIVSLIRDDTPILGADIILLSLGLRAICLHGYI